MIQDFHRPTSLDEAVRLKAGLGERAFFLGGGTEINLPAHPARPEHLVSLERLGLDGIRTLPDGVELGATCTLQRLLDAPETPVALRVALGHVTNRNVRNVATLGGHLGGARACASAVPALAALEALVLLIRPDGVRVEAPVLEWLSGPRADLVTAVRIPTPAPTRRVRAARFARTANDVSVAVVAVSLDRDGDLPRRPIVVAGGGSRVAARLGPLEASLDGRPLPSLDAIQDAVGPLVSPVDDVRGGSTWKRAVIGALVARAIHSAFTAEEVAR